jgi:hypothetical protein
MKLKNPFKKKVKTVSKSTIKTVDKNLLKKIVGGVSSGTAPIDPTAPPAQKETSTTTNGSKSNHY